MDPIESLQLPSSELYTSVKISPNGKYLAISSSIGILRLYQILNDFQLKFKFKFFSHLKGINDICWSPDSNYIATGSDDNSIKIWSLFTNSCIKTLIGHSYNISCLKFTNKGNLLISGSADEAIRIWDVTQGNCLKTLSTHSDPISSIDIIFDDSILVSGSYDGLIRLFDILSGQCLKTLIFNETDSSFPISFVKFSPNGKYLLSSSLDGIIRLWNYQNNKIVKTFKDEVPIMEKFSCSNEFFIDEFGKSFIISGTEYGEVKIWELDSKKLVKIYKENSKKPILQINVFNNYLIGLSMDGELNIWKLDV